MRELTTHGQLALLAVIRKQAKEETPCRIRSIYEEYTTLCESSGDRYTCPAFCPQPSPIYECWESSPPTKTGAAHEGTTTVTNSMSPTSAAEAMDDVPRLDDEIHFIKDTAARNDRHVDTPTIASERVCSD